jgi:hypothetical protein
MNLVPRLSDQQIDDLETEIQSSVGQEGAEEDALAESILSLIREVKEIRRSDRFLQSQRMTRVRGGRGRR